MVPRLVLVHGIGAPRRPDSDRRKWISALAEGARLAGHSLAAGSLIAGDLAEIGFVYYSDLFARPGRQGAGDGPLDAVAEAVLRDLLAEIIDAHRDTGGDPGNPALVRAGAQLSPAGRAQGSGEVARQTINAATTLLGARPWARAGQWAGGKLLAGDLSQVARYLTRGERDGSGRTLDARIRGVLADALGPGPAVVVAHSLGTVVSFEALQDFAGAVPLFVTLGSPLAMRAIVWPRLVPQPPATPPTVARWLNFWDRDDIVVPRPILESDVRPNAAGVLPETRRTDADGVWTHTAEKYLSKPNVAGPVIEALESVRGVS